MLQGSPSRTALGAAAHRAAHQVLEQGRIFSDPLALRILGADAEEAVRIAETDLSRRRLRLFIAVRSRFAEDALTVAVERGVRQVVVLGAGLDTYAYRTSVGDRLRIFEVDHPATQAWKRDRLAEASIPVPPNLTFAPADFERETLADALSSSEFDSAQPTFFTWLGVVPYLTERAFFSTLGFIAGLAGGAHVVFDYSNPQTSDDHNVAREALAARVASVGESFRSHYDTAALHARLVAMGLQVVDDIGPALIRERYFGNRGGSTSNNGGHVIYTSTICPEQ
jgi:methyltransferase (TIGR00027 family)